MKKPLEIDRCTEAIARYVNRHNIDYMDMSRKTGIGYWQIYNSVGNAKRQRPLRADEFMKICEYLCMNPFDFYKGEKE